MKTILLIILPVILLSVFLAGGFSSPFPKQVIIPSSEPRTLLTQSPPGVGKQLQINGLKFASPSPRPTPSSPATCTNKKVAVNLLLDTSESMNDPPSKLAGLKTAVISFIGILGPDDVIGIQEFSAPHSGRPLSCGASQPACNVLSIGKVNRSIASAAVMNLGFHGSTFMRSGFILSNSLITPALTTYPTSEYNWVFVFFSDGKPFDGVNHGPTGFAPYPYTLDSQSPLNNPDVTTNIKANMRLITVGIVDADRTFMADIASPGSENTYFSATGSDLTDIFRSIAGSICQ